MIVVTGGAGFIGSNLVSALLAKNHHDIIVCDHLGNDSKWRNLAKHEVAGIVQPDDLFGWLEKNKGKVEIIFHLGAISSTTETDVDLILNNNFNLSLKLWNWCTENKVRFIYSSSYSTFGDGSNGFEDDSSIEYLKKLRPLNPYGWSKNLFDLRVARLVEDGGATPPQWAGLKLFNVYGPNENHKGNQKSVLAQIFPHALKGLPVRLFRSENTEYKDGEQKRDFIYVKDCTRIMLWFMENPKVNGLFNVGSGKARSFNELADCLYKSLGKKTKIEYVDMPAVVRDKYQYITEASLKKIRAAGFNEPLTSLEDGVSDYVKNYLCKDDPYN